MKKVRDICREIRGFPIGDEERVIACVYVDRGSKIRAVVFPDALVIQAGDMVSEIALDDVREVRHDTRSGRLVVVTGSGRIEVGPSTNE